MKKLILTLVTFFLFQFIIFGQQKTITNNENVSLSTKIEIPETNSNDIVVTHTGYSLLYNEKYEQANWVAYELTKEKTKKLFERSNKFIPDPHVKTGTANDNDYSGSGYDKGHLAPAADMGWSSVTMAESFYYSNMSPQIPSFNRGIWKKLEELVRTWAIENNTIYIVTGPILTSGLQTIGPNKVAVPKYFYKVILDYTEPYIKGIGFIIPNMGSSEQLQHFAVTIDSIENITGINFFPSLPDEQENIIEKKLCINCWSWNNSKNKNSVKSEIKSSTTVQCLGTTKTGLRCKKTTKNKSGFCNLHEKQK